MGTGDTKNRNNERPPVFTPPFFRTGYPAGLIYPKVQVIVYLRFIISELATFFSQ
jgi:hypothetical protein